MCPVLRDREIASVARYQRLFREFIDGSMDDDSEMAQLRAELAASAAVAAHNHVLRRWLRGESPDPAGELDRAMRQVTALFGDEGSGHETVIALFRTRQETGALLAAIRRLGDDVREA